MRNRELAQIFERIGDALEFKGENPFKIGAYRKAARVLSDLTEDIEVLQKQGKLREIPGIGEGIAQKIEEYLKTGSMKKYEEAISGIPEGLLTLLSIQGMGPKTLKLAHDKLGVKNLDNLKKVLDDGSLAKLPGMGDKKVQNIKEGLKQFTATKEEKRISIGIALPLVEEVINYLKKIGVKKVAPAGSLRRMKETVGDIDILVASSNGEQVVNHFVNFPARERILAKGETKGSIIVKEGHQIDIRVVDEDSFGAALQYFTGSKPHNIKLRTIARKRGLKISEYGVFKGKEKIAGRTEEEVYKTLGLPWIPPELREDRGEIESAHNLPPIIDYSDIKGDLHIHSKYSDGANSIREIAEFAKKLGYKYIGIADHTRTIKSKKRMTAEVIAKRAEEIKAVEKEIGIRIFNGMEVEIRRDGSLDLEDELLKALDIVIAAVHSFAKQDMTGPIVDACTNPYVDVIAHPTGRLISRRQGYEVDLEKVIAKAYETGTALEINAYYDRLDLSDVNARRAKEHGIKLIISSDAHNLWMMKDMRFGVGVARRAWLSREDVLNTLSLDDIEKWIKRESQTTND